MNGSSERLRLGVPFRKVSGLFDFFRHPLVYLGHQVEQRIGLCEDLRSGLAGVSGLQSQS